NHDEQRIASPEFVGNPNIAKPAMLVSALLSSSPTMIYFGQELGEPGAENAGFGHPSRTSIFDYVGVPQHQKWMNHGAFDGGLLNDNEKQLRHFYQQVMNFSLEHSSMTGEYRDLHQINNLSDSVYAFLRFDHQELTIVAANFSQHITERIHLKVPSDVIQKLKIADGNYLLDEHIEGIQQQVLNVEKSIGSFSLELKPLASLVWVFPLSE
ncbi:alpha amylase C-terminal domain-containing protein, partial [Vibrio splendidus]